MTAALFAGQSITVTDITRALEQLDEIHGRLARADVYRGWRSLPVALSGLVGLAAAALFPYVVGDARSHSPRAWVLYWIGVALCALLVGCAHLMWRHVREESVAEQRRTHHVAAQFLPALSAALLLTIVLMGADLRLTYALPGLWTLLFGVGVFSARPVLVRGAGLVAAYYALAGIVLLLLFGARPLDARAVPTSFAFLSWAVGATFGGGQLLAAAVLYWSLERDHQTN